MPRIRRHFSITLDQSAPRPLRLSQEGWQCYFGQTVRHQQPTVIRDHSYLFPSRIQELQHPVSGIHHLSFHSGGQIIWVRVTVGINLAELCPSAMFGPTWEERFSLFQNLHAFFGNGISQYWRYRRLYSQEWREIVPCLAMKRSP